MVVRSGASLPYSQHTITLRTGSTHFGALGEITVWHVIVNSLYDTAPQPHPHLTNAQSLLTTIPKSREYYLLLYSTLKHVAATET